MVAVRPIQAQRYTKRRVYLYRHRTDEYVQVRVIGRCGPNWKIERVEDEYRFLIDPSTPLFVMRSRR